MVSVQRCKAWQTKARLGRSGLSRELDIFTSICLVWLRKHAPSTSLPLACHLSPPASSLGHLSPPPLPVLAPAASPAPILLLQVSVRLAALPSNSSSWPHPTCKTMQNLPWLRNLLCGGPLVQMEPPAAQPKPITGRSCSIIAMGAGNP